MSLHIHSLSDRHIIRSTTPIQGHSTSEKKTKNLKSSTMLSKWMKNTLNPSMKNLNEKSKENLKTGKSLAKYKVGIHLIKKGIVN